MDKKKKSAPESTQPPNLESQPENLEKPFQLWASKLQDQIIFSDKEYPTLVFLTTLLFSMASLSQFGSLLRFSPTFSGAETACGKLFLQFTKRNTQFFFSLCRSLGWDNPLSAGFLEEWFRLEDLRPPNAANRHLGHWNSDVQKHET